MAGVSSIATPSISIIMLVQQTNVPGTEGYADAAEWLIPRYESVSAAEKYRSVAHLLPAEPCRILDVGAGTGIDAQWCANQGHQVVAVEPVAQLRMAGAERHPSPLISWLDDSFPDLSKVQCGQKCFDVVLVSAVWNHLETAERARAMNRVAALLNTGGLLVMSLRHGPSPADRRMFDISADETVALAVINDLNVIANTRTASVQLHNRQAGVDWTWLVFAK